MARQIQTIRAQITASYVAAMAAIGITIDPTKWSRRNLQQLAINTFAEATGIFEQLLDAFKVDVEAIAIAAPPQTRAWIQKSMFNFQYDATDPQVVQWNESDAVYKYPQVDPAKRIITNCSVVAGAFGTTRIKTAKGGSVPVALSSDELTAAQSYANILQVPGIIYYVTSEDSDKMFMQIDVRYNGLYSAIISDSVIAAINSYLNGIPFDGSAEMDNLIGAIKAVPGVIEVVLINVNGRRDTDPYVPGDDNLVTGRTWVQSNYPTVAGYIVPETQAGYTLTDPRDADPSISNLNLISA